MVVGELIALGVLVITAIPVCIQLYDRYCKSKPTYDFNHTDTISFTFEDIYRILSLKKS